MTEDDPLIGTLVAGRYEVKGRLGQGGMGAIYLAHQRRLDRDIVLKVLLSNYVEDELAVQRFEKEALAISRLVHPNIVTIFDFGQIDDNDLFIAMEHIPGRSLREALSYEEPPSSDLACHIVRGVLQGLSEAHLHHVVHRDLKPENVMLTRSGPDENFVKLLDFGLARSLDKPEEDAQRLTRANTIPGTPAYLPPERASGVDDDARSDLYALGAMWFELYTGRPPFLADTPLNVIVKHIHEPAPRVTDVNPNAEIPPAIEDLIASMLSKVPSERPSTAVEVLRQLEEAVSPETWRVTKMASMSVEQRQEIHAWADDGLEEIPDLEFGYALGLEDEEPPIALIRRRDANPIELTKKKTASRNINQTLMMTSGSSHEGAEENRHNDRSPTSAPISSETIGVDEVSHPTQLLTTDGPLPIAPLASIEDAKDQVHRSVSVNALARVLVSYLLVRFERALVLERRGLRITLCASQGVRPIDDVDECFRDARGLWELARAGETHYGVPIDNDDWLTFHHRISAGTPRAFLLSPIEAANGALLVVYAEQDSDELCEDLSDISALLKEAKTSLTALTKPQRRDEANDQH